MAKNLLKHARVYLSGPMDFVASREMEKRVGWRIRVGNILREHGATVFDPWNKPEVRGLHEYGREDETSIDIRDDWSFAATDEGARSRARCASVFWETLHIDLRMVDLSDFVIAYCPTNIYSVGTPHEIILARQQHKPVLFVSPPVAYPSLAELGRLINDRPDAVAALARLKREIPIKENARGIPSLWYMPLIGGDHFFDGFGFGLPEFAARCGWTGSDEPDVSEREGRYARPLLPFLDSLARGERPQRWDDRHQGYVQDDDWLLLDLTTDAEKSHGG